MDSFFEVVASDAEKWDTVLVQAQRLLDASNDMVMPDSGLTFAQQTAWLNYRQTLKEIRETFVNPDDVKFPERPEGER
jgi:hypothetical protein